MGVVRDKNVLTQPKGRGRAFVPPNLEPSNVVVQEVSDNEVVVYATYNPGRRPRSEYPKVLSMIVEHLLKMTLEDKIPR